MHFDIFLNSSTFQCWRSCFCTEVCSCSYFPAEAVLRIKEVETVDSVDDLTTSRSIGGHRFQNFEMFDPNIASALKEIITNPYSKYTVSLEVQKAQGRQIACVIYEYFRVIGAREIVLDFTDLFSSTLHGDDIQDFDTRWDQALPPTGEVHHHAILESLFVMRRRGSDQFQTVLAMYEQEINQHHRSRVIRS